MRTIKILSAFIYLLTIPTAYAQESSVGIKGGVNFSGMYTKEINDKNLNPGLHFGVLNRISVSDFFVIQPELLYSVKGVKYTYDDFADGTTKFNLNYIDLPVKLVFNLSENFSLQAGGYIGYLVNAKLKTDAEVLNFFDVTSEDEIDRENFNTLDYGLVAGLGFEQDPLIFGVNYNLGLNNIAKDDKLSHDMLGDAKNTVIQVYVGILF
jgi:hypothetical protein